MIAVAEIEAHDGAMTMVAAPLTRFSGLTGLN